MSMFLCPLCGKQVSIRYFQPEIFDDEVEIFHNASLGYRKGFEKILGFDLAEFPELREKLENRIHHMRARSVMEVQKYELLTANQYLQQMERAQM